MRRFTLSFLITAGLLLAQSGPSSALWRQPSVSAAAHKTAAKAANSSVRLTFPVDPKSVRFAVIGDSGTGHSPQYEVADQMAKWHEAFPFDFVIMLGDNIYGGDSAHSFKKKFEDPYQPLLEAGVKFYASLGNHDNPSERFYKLFNMDGRRYYSFKKGNVRFFALDSNYMDAEEINWLERELQGSGERWKICFCHHPLYSDGRFHGPDLDLRALLEPLFEKYGVNVVLSGHDHVYERIKPQHGVDYFVLGSAGELRTHDLRRSSEMAKGFDTDRAFMMVEVTSDQFYFETVSRTGEVADYGALPWQRNSGRGEVAARGPSETLAARRQSPALRGQP